MLIDGRGIAPGGRVSADVCVIGTGPAGAVVAAELAGRGVDVVVVEGGGARYTSRHADTYRGDPDSDAHAPLEVVRQKRLGGTSAWRGRCAPLDPLDLVPREWVTSPGWPISQEELAPYYPQAQRHFDMDDDEDAAAAPVLPSDVLDAGRTWRWSPPTSFAGRMRALARAPNVRLIVEATVMRLDRDPVSGAVEEAVVSPRPGVEVTIGANTFVLAAGALESTRILLASDRQTPAGLGNEHDQVGRHYMTHPAGEIGTVVLSTLGRDGGYARRMLALTPAAQEEHGLANLKAALWFPGEHIGNVTRGWRRAAGHAASWAAQRATRRRVLPSPVPSDATTCRLRFDAEQLPDPQNRVTLSRRRDRFGQRRLVVRHRVSGTDRESIRRSMELIGAELTRLGLGTVDTGDAARVDDMPFTDGTHQMGLLRMADSPRDGVVDRDCRVHGCANLYVAGSAVFPTAGAVGPTLTIVALACRIAERVAAERVAGDRARAT